MRGPRPSPTSHAVDHLAWLMQLEDLPGYRAISQGSVPVRDGEALPFNHLVDHNGVLRARTAKNWELKELRTEGKISDFQTLIIPCRFNSFSREERNERQDERECEVVDADVAWRVDYSELDAAIQGIHLVRQTAKRMTLKSLKTNFSKRQAWGMSSLDAEQVGWAAWGIPFSNSVAYNTIHLAHYVSEHVLAAISQYNPVVWACDAKRTRRDHVGIFLSFSDKVPIEELRQLEDLLSILFCTSLTAQHLPLLASYATHNGIERAVPGPVAGSLFDLATGTRLPDSLWKGYQPGHWQLPRDKKTERHAIKPASPSLEECREIITAYYVTNDTEWGERNPFAKPKHSSAVYPKVPGKVRETVSGNRVDEPLTADLLCRHLEHGKQAFITTRHEESARFLIIDFDVKGADGERVVVDEGIAEQIVDWGVWWTCHDIGLRPMLRLSGQGLYIEFRFDGPVPKTILQDLVLFTLVLFNSHDLMATSDLKGTAKLPDGTSAILDVSSLTHLVRLPGCRHRKTGRVSAFLEGGLVPDQITLSEAALLAPELRSTFIPPSEAPETSTSSHEETEGKGTQSSSCPDWLFSNGHLSLTRKKRERFVEFLVARVFQEKCKRPGRPPNQEPYEAALALIVDQACRTAGSFTLPTMRLAKDVRRMKAGPMKARNPITRALKSLEQDFQFIRKVKDHAPPRVENGVSLKGSCALYTANMQRLHGQAISCFTHDNPDMRRPGGTSNDS